MKKLISQVKEELVLINTNAREKKSRPVGMPSRYKFNQEIQEGLSHVELRIAYLTGLIGKKGSKGSIIENGIKF